MQYSHFAQIFPSIKNKVNTFDRNMVSAKEKLSALKLYCCIIGIVSNLCRLLMKYEWNIQELSVLIFIDREAREIMHLVASVRLSVRLSVRPFVRQQRALGVITSLRCLSVCL